MSPDDTLGVRLGYESDGKAVLHVGTGPFMRYTMALNDEEGAFYYVNGSTVTHICPKPPEPK